MDKKAFLAGNTLVYVYSIISLAVIAILFSFLFLLLSADKEATNIFDVFKEKESILESSNIDLYETANYYLYTKVRVDKNETSLQELIALYCHNKNKNLLTYIQRISLSLLPERSYLNLYCLYGTNDCNNIKKGNYQPIITITSSEITLAGIKSINPGTILSLSLPALSSTDIACLDISQHKKEQSNSRYERNLKLYDKNIDEIGRIPTPLSKVAQITNENTFVDSIGKLSSAGEVLLSQTKDLWIINEDGEWCNSVNTDCSKGISINKLIECRGDYLCTK